MTVPKDPTFAREGELEIGLVQQTNELRPHLLSSAMKLVQQSGPLWQARQHYITAPEPDQSRERRLVKIRNRGAVESGATYTFATAGPYDGANPGPFGTLQVACCCDIAGVAGGGSVVRPGFLVFDGRQWNRFGPKVLTGDWGVRFTHPEAITTVNLSIQWNPGENKPGSRIWAGVVFFINFYSAPELRWM